MLLAVGGARERADGRVRQSLANVRIELKASKADCKASREEVAVLEGEKAAVEAELKTALKANEVSLIILSGHFNTYVFQLLGYARDNRQKKALKWKKKYNEVVAQVKEESIFFKGRRRLKPRSQLKRAQGYKRDKKVKELIKKATDRILDAHHMDVKGYGPIEITLRKEMKEEVGFDTEVFISMRKTCPYATTVAKASYLHDSGISKKKLHELHMLNKNLPSLSEIKKQEIKLEEYITNNLEINSSEDAFHVMPAPLLKWILLKRGLNSENILNRTLDALVGGDGRGTGGSFKSLILEWRLMNEGRKIYKSDHAYLLSLVRGDEDRKLMPGRLKVMLTALEALQDNGIWISDSSKPHPQPLVHIRVRLHLLGDAKWFQVCCGLMRFCDEGSNCLTCFADTEEREDPKDRWEEEPDR